MLRLNLFSLLLYQEQTDFQIKFHLRLFTDSINLLSTFICEESSVQLTKIHTVNAWSDFGSGRKRTGNLGSFPGWVGRGGMAVHYRPPVAIISSGSANNSQIRIYFLGWRVTQW